MSINKVVLFGEKAAGVYRMSDIYFPDPLNPISPEQAGKIVPAVGSLVVDDTTGLHNQQYTVIAVDQETYYPTLIPSTFSYDTSTQPDRVLNYGNDLLMLYFQKTTIQKNGQDIVVTRLIVDNKLSLFGNHAATYQLLRYNSAGELETISRWYRPNGIMAGTAIPMLETGVQGVRKCDGCYTDVTLKEGESVICRIYSAGGVQISELTLIAKRAHMLNELASVANPIVNMIIRGNQMLQDNVLFLYVDQNPRELAIFPHLIYSDNTDRRVAIDGLKGFVYGLEHVHTDIPGMEYRLLVKYYLGDDDILIGEENKYAYYHTGDTVWTEGKTYYRAQASGDMWIYIKVPESSYTIGETITNSGEYYERVEVAIEYDASTKVRFIVREAVVRIVNLDYERASKISLIPVWNASQNRYTFYFLKYMQAMDVSPRPITENTTNVNYLKFGITGENPDGGKCDGTTQEGTIVYRNIVGESYVEARQKYYFTLKNRNTNMDIVHYLISDTLDADKQYGRENGVHVRPRIYYRATPAVEGEDQGKTGYFIPESIFAASSNQTSVERVVDNFYYQANPPKDPETQNLIIPTHFLVKDLNGTILSRYNNTNIPEIPIDDCFAMLYLKLPNGALDNVYVNQTLIVEFIRVEDNTTKYIYGVPVDVMNG